MRTWANSKAARDEFAALKNENARLEKQFEGLKRQVRELFAAARAENLYVGAGKDLRRSDTEEAQYGPLAKALLEAVTDRKLTNG